MAASDWKQVDNPDISTYQYDVLGNFVGSAGQGSGSVFSDPSGKYYQWTGQGAMPPGGPTGDETKVLGGLPPGEVDPTQGDPHTLAAQLLQQEFQQWQTTFQPIELAAMNQLSFNNPQVLPTAVGQAKQAAQGASQAAGGILQRTNRELGIQQNPQQQAVSNRVLNLNRATMTAGAENTARQNVRTQDEMILMGAAPNPNITKAAIAGS